MQLRQVLVTCPPDATEQRLASCRERIAAARARLVAGEAFDEVAKADSDGPAAPFGGRLGRLGREEMESVFGDTFAAAALRQEIHALGPVLQTSLGFHVLQVLARDAAVTNTLAEVQDEVTRIAALDAEQAAYRRYVDSVLAESEISYGE